MRQGSVCFRTILSSVVALICSAGYSNAQAVKDDARQALMRSQRYVFQLKSDDPIRLATRPLGRLETNPSGPSQNVCPAVLITTTYILTSGYCREAPTARLHVDANDWSLTDTAVMSIMHRDDNMFKVGKYIVGSDQYNLAIFQVDKSAADRLGVVKLSHGHPQINDVLVGIDASWWTILYCRVTDVDSSTSLFSYDCGRSFAFPSNILFFTKDGALIGFPTPVTPTRRYNAITISGVFERLPMSIVNAVDK